MSEMVHIHRFECHGRNKEFVPLDEYRTLRDERDRLREALREIYEGRWTPGISCCYEDDARSIYPTREMRIRHIAQAALTPAEGGQDGHAEVR